MNGLLLVLSAGCLVNGALHDELEQALVEGGDDTDVPGPTPNCEPGPEVCNGADDDCDAQIDDDDPDLDAASAITAYADADHDGFGDPDAPRTACAAPADHVLDDTDCDDTDAATFPGGDEICGDAVDQDCNGAALACFGGGISDLTIDALARHSSQTTVYSVGVAGDVDGDGVSDLLIGMARNAAFGPRDGGTVHLVSGGLVGNQVIETVAFGAVYGSHEDDGFGASVSTAGDVDADGFADVLVAGGDILSYNGVVLLVRGPISGPVADTGAAARLESDEVYTGLAVSGDGDVDGDLVPDLLIGVDIGTTYVVSGSVRGTQSLGAAAQLEVRGESFGASEPAMAGDVDGDGLTDLLIGARNAGDPSSPLANPGVAYLVLGGADGILNAVADADARLVGETELSFAGNSVAGAGDVDGDGLPDLLIGAYSEDGAEFDLGAAYVFPGTVRGVKSLAEADVRLFGEASSDHAGCAVDGGGDLDGDGIADVLVGAWGHDDGGPLAGATYLLLGPLAGTDTLVAADAKLRGLPEELTGTEAALEDLDGDGLAELVIRGNLASDGVIYVVGGGTL